MRDNYVAKYARKFNRGGAHQDKSKYVRSTGMSKHSALDELADDLDLEDELEAEASLAYSIALDLNQHDIPHTQNDDFMFEDFE